MPSERPCSRFVSGTSSATLLLPTQWSVCCIDQLNPPPIADYQRIAPPSVRAACPDFTSHATLSTIAGTWRGCTRTPDPPLALSLAAARGTNPTDSHCADAQPGYFERSDVTAETDRRCTTQSACLRKLTVAAPKSPTCSGQGTPDATYKRSAHVVDRLPYLIASLKQRRRIRSSSAPLNTLRRGAEQGCARTVERARLPWKTASVTVDSNFRCIGSGTPITRRAPLRAVTEWTSNQTRWCVCRVATPTCCWRIGTCEVDVG